MKRGDIITFDDATPMVHYEYAEVKDGEMPQIDISLAGVCPAGGVVMYLERTEITNCHRVLFDNRVVMVTDSTLNKGRVAQGIDETLP